MPVIRGEIKRQSDAVRNAIISRLYDELTGKQTADGPLIFEIPIGITDRLEVIVIWEGWKDVPLEEERADYVLAAYGEKDKKDKEPLSPRIMTVFCATYEEAMGQHLLPYAVEPMMCPGEANLEEVKQAMQEEGALITPSGHLELRFPTLPMAEEVHSRLSERLPNAFWGISQRVGTTAASMPLSMVGSEG